MPPILCSFDIHLYTLFFSHIFWMLNLDIFKLTPHGTKTIFIRNTYGMDACFVLSVKTISFHSLHTYKSHQNYLACVCGVNLFR